MAPPVVPTCWIGMAMHHAFLPGRADKLRPDSVLFVNASVIMFHGVKGKSGNVLRHWVLPALGFAVIGYVLSGLAKDALFVGAIWLGIGIVWYLVLRFVLGRSGELALSTKE